MPIINVFVSSPDTYSERRFESTLTIQELKVSKEVSPTRLALFAVRLSRSDEPQDKLHSITGISPQYQRLFFAPSRDGPSTPLGDDGRSLEQTGVKDTYHLKVSFQASHSVELMQYR